MGLLKILKLEASQSTEESAPKGVAAPSNISTNQNLDGHSGNVIAVSWNDPFQKLASADDDGLIIVWALYDNQGNSSSTWQEEMINNRNQSYVNSMKWTADGQLICILYHDGAVILGTVEGTRLWSIKLDTSFKFMEWSSATSEILFVTDSNVIKVYDEMGKYQKDIKLTLPPSQHKTKCDSEKKQIIGFKLHCGDDMDTHDQYVPNLAIAYDDCSIELRKSIDINDDPICFHSGITHLLHCTWNRNGTILALCGRQSNVEEGTESFFPPLIYTFNTYCLLE